MRMHVLAQYLLREFFKLLIICLTVFVAIYLMIDFASGIDDFIKAAATRGVMIAYFLYKIPAISTQMLPVATLTTVIIMFSLMKRNKESQSAANVMEAMLLVSLSSLSG